MGLDHSWTTLLPLTPSLLVLAYVARVNARDDPDRPPVPRDSLRGAGRAPHHTGWRRVVFDGDHVGLHRGRGE
ncbi:hypothetical protein ACW9HR_37380 [Nocardia gipuzkoensis]